MSSQIHKLALGGKKKTGRKAGSIIYGASAYRVLKVIAGSAAIGVALAIFIAVPNLATAAKPLIKYIGDRDRRIREKERKNLLAAIERLKSRRMVKLEERNGETYLVVTRQGKEALKQFEIESVSIQKPDEWDGKWRIVLFDIPEKYKKSRNALRIKLRELGFYSLQKSAFIYPYDCHDEIDFIANFFRVARHIQYLESGDLGEREGEIRHYFSLSLK